MATKSSAQVEALPAEAALEQARGLAELAFGSFTRSADFTQVRHLALLPSESLELDLDDPAQRQFGDYELLEILGEGGMGVVYRARQASLDREVAVKLLSAGPWASKDFIARFEREAQNAARMQHPGIVTIYEVGSFEGMQFFSMRLVRGESLSARLKRGGKSTPREAAALMRTVAEAVGYAHDLGVLHLDLKPANILLDASGRPYVADFGLARRLENALAVENEEVSGTPAYMAPEQAQVRTHKLSQATDIWGLGAILYQLLTGQPPFRAETAQDTVKLVLEGEVRAPRSFNATVPLDLEAIVLRCLNRDPHERYSSARALADDLTRFIEGRPVQARPLNGAQRLLRWMKREPKLAATLACAVAALVIGLIATSWQWHRAQSNAATASSLLWESRRDAALRLQQEGRGFEALAPILANIGEKEAAGKAVTVERHEVGAILNQGVVLVDRLHLQGAGKAEPFAAAISDDGSMYAVADSDLTVHWYGTYSHARLGSVDLLGLPTSSGRPQMPLLLRFIGNRRLLVTMEWLAFAPAPSEQDSYLIDLGYGTVVPFPAAFGNLASAAFGADGKHAMLFDGSGRHQLWQVAPWHPLTPLLARDPLMQSVVLDEDGQHLLGFDGTAQTLTWYDLSSMPRGRDIPVPDRQAISAWAESPNQNQFAFGNVRGEVFVFDKPTGKVISYPTPLGGDVQALAYSEDGAWLAAGRKDGAVYVYDAATGEPVNAGQMQAGFQVSRVYLDHRQRLLIASGTGQSAMWRLSPPLPSGLPAQRLITSPVQPGFAGPYASAFSARTGLIFSAGNDGELRFWRAPASPVLDARAGRLISGNLEFDGRHIVDVAYDRVRLRALEGAGTTAWVRLPQPVGFAQLTADARTLLATAGTKLYVFDAATMHERFAPIDVGNTPMRLVADAAGRTVVLDWSIASTRGFMERARAFDLRDGRPINKGVDLAGPLRQLEMSADGARLLVVGAEGMPAQVLDVRTFKSIGRFVPPDGESVFWASFKPASSQLYALTRVNDDPRMQAGELWSWTPQQRPQRLQSLASGWPVGVLGMRNGAFVAGRDFDWLRRDDGSQVRIPVSNGEEPVVAAAISHDGRVIAQAFRYGVQLYDADSGAAIGPLLPADLGPIGMIAQIAFSPDDSQVLARTAEAHWVRWKIPLDARPLKALQRDATVLAAVADEPAAAISPTRIGKDQGAWVPAPSQPPIQTSDDALGKAIPARVPTTDPDLLDLTSAYNVESGVISSLTASSFASLAKVPLGIVRIQGIDYDVRGAVRLHMSTSRGAEMSYAASVDGIAVPRHPIAAFHVLLMASSGTAPASGEEEAALTVHYVDGTSASLPLRAGFELPVDLGQRESVPLGWAFGDHLRLMGYAPQQVFSDPRLVNPHPERLIDRIDFNPAGKSDSAPVLFAITAEPVIPAAESRSVVQDIQKPQSPADQGEPR